MGKRSVDPSGKSNWFHPPCSEDPDVVPKHRSTESKNLFFCNVFEPTLLVENQSSNGRLSNTKKNPSSVQGDERRHDHHMDVSENRGTLKSSILIGFSIINHPFCCTPIVGNTHMIINFFTLQVIKYSKSLSQRWKSPLDALSTSSGLQFCEQESSSTTVKTKHKKIINLQNTPNSEGRILALPWFLFVSNFLRNLRLLFFSVQSLWGSPEQRASLESQRNRSISAVNPGIKGGSSKEEAPAGMPRRVPRVCDTSFHGFGPVHLGDAKKKVLSVLFSKFNAKPKKKPLKVSVSLDIFWQISWQSLQKSSITNCEMRKGSSVETSLFPLYQSAT